MGWQVDLLNSLISATGTLNKAMTEQTCALSKIIILILYIKGQYLGLENIGYTQQWIDIDR